MQMAMAVNMALMTLTKQGIFCTEPHRVPIGGKISHCLFDKTGKLFYFYNDLYDVEIFVRFY
jgi:manganese-transporting P-type ATPase